MNDELTDKEFVKEMQILWQKSNQTNRVKFGNIIRAYFDYGSRADLILDKLQIKL